MENFIRVIYSNVNGNWRVCSSHSSNAVLQRLTADNNGSYKRLDSKSSDWFFQREFHNCKFSKGYFCYTNFLRRSFLDFLHQKFCFLQQCFAATCWVFTPIFWVFTTKWLFTLNCFTLNVFHINIFVFTAKLLFFYTNLLFLTFLHQTFYFQFLLDPVCYQQH